MGEREFWDLGRVSEQDLREGLARAVAIGARADAVVVAHLAEVEERRLFSKDGFSSLFEYCVKALALSEGEAFHRITAARVARTYPVVFGLLARRDINLSALRLLRDHLSADNHVALLAEARGKTKLQLQECLATRFPVPSAGPRVRQLPSGARAGSAARATIVPLSAERYRVQVDVTRDCKEKLDLARALGSHANPRGDLALLFEQALDLWLERSQSRRFAQVKRPRAPAPARAREVKLRSRRRQRIRSAVLRAVVARDGLQCAYVAPNGRRCAARSFLEVHHEQAWARGGSDEPPNLKLLCRSHNRFFAEQDFGKAHLAHVTQRQA